MNIKDRINELSFFAMGEGEEINKKSLDTFLAFSDLLDSGVIDDMCISLTPNNEIYLSYEENYEKRKSFRFRSDGTIKYIEINCSKYR